jgi:hypothetical protein
VESVGESVPLGNSMSTLRRCDSGVGSPCRGQEVPSAVSFRTGNDCLIVGVGPDLYPLTSMYSHCQCISRCSVSTHCVYRFVTVVSLTVKMSTDKVLRTTFPEAEQFQGFMKPCRFEGEIRDLEVKGTIPDCVNGTFFRVMPDPQYIPLLRMTQ